MALERKTWIDLTAQVPDKGKRRFDHVCGPGRTLIITNDLGKYRAWCFRCVDGDSYERQRSLEELSASLRRREQADALCSRVPSPPTPATHNVDEWPREAQLWFFKAGLSRADIGALGAYYHAPSGRVVLPVTGANGSGSWWQARAIEKGQIPKYLGPEDSDRSRVCPRYGTGSRLVLTEDILSAYKIGKAQASVAGWCMMGVALQPWVLAQILKGTYDEVLVWLDPDPPGQRAARRVLRELRLFGVSCRNIVSKRDPKNHSISEIKEYVSTIQVSTIIG